MTDWKLTCTPEQYERIRSDPAFAVLVSLARAINQVRFASEVLRGLGDDPSPAATRQQTSAILVVAASLVEGIDLARLHSGRHFRELSEFNAVRALWKDDSNRRLIEENLRPARNRSVSHFDAEHVATQLADLSFADECVFSEGSGALSSEVHHKLADGLAAMGLIGPVTDEAEMGEKMTRVTRELGRLAGQFIAAAEGLIAAALTGYGFRGEPL